MRVLFLVLAIVLLSVALTESRKNNKGKNNQKTNVQLRSTSSNKSNQNSQNGKVNNKKSKFRQAAHKVHEKVSSIGKWLGNKISSHNSGNSSGTSGNGTSVGYSNSTSSGSSSSGNNSNTSAATAKANAITLVGNGNVQIGNSTFAVKVNLGGLLPNDANSAIAVNVTSGANSTIAVNVSIIRNTTDSNKQPPKDDSGSSSTEIPSDEFQVRSADDLSQADNHMKIGIMDLEMPAGKSMNLELLPGATLTFRGNLKFGFKLWEGPLIQVRGTNVSIVGAPGHLIDCGGKRWWDGKGGNGGVKKPKFFYARLTDSTVTGLNVKNTPVHGFSVNSCKNVVFSKITFDNADGAIKNGGHNTDAFDVGNSDNVVIKNCVVNNQDDCLAINSGTNIVFENNFCSGGHGISIGSVGKRRSNVVSNVTIRNNTVSNSDNGVRIKTVSKATGSVDNIVFENIVLKDIKKVGITIQGNYLNGGPKGDPTPGVPITNLKMKNIRGNVLQGGTNIYVFVANASNWSLDSQVTGGKKTRYCKGFPKDIQPLC